MSLLVRLATGCVLVALCGAHDVYIGTTTIDCTSDDHACQTSGTAMLGPGETLQITTNPDRDVEYVSMGHLEAERAHTRYLPRLRLDGVDMNNSAHLVDSDCTLEFFSVVWFCNTHEDMTMARNATYGLSVPSDAQHSQFVAWGRAESTQLVLGWTVQYDAARARHKVGFMHPGWALGIGALVTGGAGMLLLYYYRKWHRDDQENAQQKQNAWIVYIVALMSHGWFVVLPLHRAQSVQHVLPAIAVTVEEYYWANVSLLILTFILALLPLSIFGFFMKPSEKTERSCRMCTKSFGAGLACLTVILYVVVISVPGVFQLQIGFFSAYAAILLGVSLYFWITASAVFNIPRIQQLQCLLLLIISLIYMRRDTNNMFYEFSAAQWAISILILQVLAVQVDAIEVNHAPEGVKWSAIVISLWAMLVFDLTSYGVAAFIMGWWVLRPVGVIVRTKCRRNGSYEQV